MTTSTAHNADTTKDAHLAAFAALAPGLPGAGTDWVDDLRRDALDRFAHSGLPHRGLEAWKFTGLTALDQNAFAPSRAATTPAPQLAIFPAPETCAAQLVFINGHLAPELSRIAHTTAGITITTLAAALNEHPGLI